MSNKEEERHKSSLNDNRRSISPYTVESLLSLDNTLLCSVETDGEYTEGHNSSIGTVQTEGVKADITSRSVSPDTNEWQDESLVDQIFAQFYSQNEEEIVLDTCDNVTSSHLSCKENVNAEPIKIHSVESTQKKCPIELDTSVSYNKASKISCLNVNFDNDILKDDSFSYSSNHNNNNDRSPVIQTKFRTLNKHKISRKRLRLNDTMLKSGETDDKKMSSTKDYLFYGLSDTVKKLIQEIERIQELYRKFDVI